jgi:acetyl-CoA carboxylase biotin carboxylase subunit
VKPQGHSIEARVYAEDPDNNFAPCPGTVSRCHIPGGPGIRIDSHLFPGYVVPRYYDSLLAKVISWGTDREEAINRLAGALNEFTTVGIKTSASLCAKILKSDRFRRGELSSDMVDQFIAKAR